MSDTLVWSADTDTFVAVEDSARRETAITAILDRLRADDATDEALSEERRRSLLRWSSTDRR